MHLQIKSIFFLQTFKYGIRQFLRWNFYPDILRIFLRVVVAPGIIFFLRDFSVSETDSLLFPCSEVFTDLEELLCFITTEHKAGLTVYFINSQTVDILQSKEGMHQAYVRVNIGNPECRRTDIKKIGEWSFDLMLKISTSSRGNI